MYVQFTSAIDQEVRALYPPSNGHFVNIAAGVSHIALPQSEDKRATRKMDLSGACAACAGLFNNVSRHKVYKENTFGVNCYLR